jgi:signal transduction histidine kinase
VAYRPDELAVEVLDESVVVSRSLTDGRGLAGMRERVALYEGVLDVGPRAEGGFAVSARFPLDSS